MYERKQANQLLASEVFTHIYTHMFMYIFLL